MILSTRSLISLGQFLGLQEQSNLRLMLEKCGIDLVDNPPQLSSEQVYAYLSKATTFQVGLLLSDIGHTAQNMRYNVSPKYRYDERWIDLGRCLLLDGYRFVGGASAGYTVAALDPTIEATVSLDDELSTELSRSDLSARDEIIRLMKNSAEDFRKQPPDFNGSLTSARTSLETIVKSIATNLGYNSQLQGSQGKFGPAVDYLRHRARFLDDNEMNGITGVYSFVSKGAHSPVGLTEEEAVRLGRSLVASMCYFLVKKHNGAGS